MYCSLSLRFVVNCFWKVYKETGVETFYCVDCYFCVYTLLTQLSLLSSHSFRPRVCNCDATRGLGRKPSKCRARKSILNNTNHVEEAVHDLRKNTMFETFVSYAVSFVVALCIPWNVTIIHITKRFLSCLYRITKPCQAHYKIIAILQLISILNMLQVIMCTYIRSRNEASKYAGERKRSTLHQSRAFRPSCPTGSGPVFSFVL